MSLTGRYVPKPAELVGLQLQRRYRSVAAYGAYATLGRRAAVLQRLGAWPDRDANRVTQIASRGA